MSVREVLRLRQDFRFLLTVPPNRGGGIEQCYHVMTYFIPSIAVTYIGVTPAVKPFLTHYIGGNGSEL